MKGKIERIDDNLIIKVTIKCAHCGADITYDIELDGLKDNNEWSFTCNECEEDSQLNINFSNFSVDVNISDVKKAWWGQANEA